MDGANESKPPEILIGHVGLVITNPAEKVEVEGLVSLTTPGSGIIFKSPDGRVSKKLSINDRGDPVWTTVPRP